MNIRVFSSKADMAEAVGNDAASTIRDAIKERGEARIIAATGASQFAFLDVLTKATGIDWAGWRCFTLMNTWAFHKRLQRAFAVTCGNG